MQGNNPNQPDEKLCSTSCRFAIESLGRTHVGELSFFDSPSLSAATFAAIQLTEFRTAKAGVPFDPFNCTLAFTPC